MDSQIKSASIVSVGNEVLSGRTVDTNAAHIGRQLRRIGVPVVSAHTVGDRREVIVRALELAASEADIVIVTGGLGPTDDDLTRQAFGDYLGCELELRDDLLEAIRNRFAARGMEMPQRNRIQACIPKAAEPIANEWGTAPGVAAERGGKLFFALPGVPREMEKMLDASVLPRLGQLAEGQAVAVQRLKCFGTGESAMAEMLGDAMDRDRNPLVNCTARIGIITLEIVATAASRDLAEAMVVDEETRLRNILGDVIYGTGEETLAEVVGHKLARAGRTLALAESCTGGLAAKLVTDVPGASAYFNRGWVTYSNEAKVAELGVPADLITARGAVSAEVAAAMAQGARRRAQADHAIGITGIAGPGGATEQKPLGLVYISVDDADGTITSRHVLFSQERSFVRLRAAQTALNALRLRLGG
ncbi:MAG: competence/damage-inducible protein A [Phycisphaerales bacterium]|nr:MAG: competence/damage-inducible protein A [Phycisphaerales bacterium]